MKIMNKKPLINTRHLQLRSHFLRCELTSVLVDLLLQKYPIENLKQHIWFCLQHPINNTFT